ncbi:MAG: type II toxin-antitoxin system VapC family toxin [Planctomycetes bacterium]|nr:type II toxin-antitoxin system VapC family toxin [Planctomycetota bacterium]
MKLYLLDSTTLSFVVEERPAVRSRLESLDQEDRAITCTIVRGEVLFGVQRLPAGKRREALALKVARVLSSFRCEPVPERAADSYARIKTDTQLRGRRLDENDLWIAASALALEAVLVTADSDFDRVGNGLRVEDWSRMT